MRRLINAQLHRAKIARAKNSGGAASGLPAEALAKAGGAPLKFDIFRKPPAEVKDYVLEVIESSHGS